MSRLTIVTFADKPLTEGNFLRKSCEAYGIHLEVLLSSPWIQNVIKLKLLYEYVSAQPPDQLLLMVDAYDVVICAIEEEIINVFESQNADILFSGESNFMYKEPAKWLEFLKKYPPQTSIYQYGNSGSNLCRAKYIKTMLIQIQDWFDIDFQDEKKLLKLKSDQYLLHRFFVENYYKQNSTLKLDIDSEQQLLGCTGGRFCVIKFPDISKWQAFTFFVLERNILKLFNLHKHQKKSKDFLYSAGKFLNKTTRHYPPVMHFPGTWDRFEKVITQFTTEQVKIPISMSGAFARLISMIAFILSFPCSIIFALATFNKKNN